MTETSPASAQRTKKMGKLRSRIGEIDTKVLELVSERLQLARQIGKLKIAEGLPIKDYRVERDVLTKNATRAATFGLYPELAEEITRSLIKYAVLAQDDIRSSKISLARGEGKRIHIIGGKGKMGQWLSHFFESMGHHVTLHDIARPRAIRSPQLTSKVFAEADVIVLSTPISKTAEIIDILADLGTKALVCDICSLKTPLLKSIARAEKLGLRVASLHPMFGPSVRLLAGRNILICKGRSAAAAREAAALFKDTSAKIIYVKLADHDRFMACVLGLSHMTNLVFARTLQKSGINAKSLDEIASTTYQLQSEVTRPVVQENPDLYYEIQKENRFTQAMMNRMLAVLTEYKSAIQKSDRKRFTSYMQAAREFMVS